jgi:hypothetical protein
MSKGFALLLMVSTAYAQERALTGAEITTTLSDQTLVGANPADKIEQIFQKSGLTLYTTNGAQSLGTWKVEANKYCSVWPPSQFWACYTVVLEDRTITFVSASGTRYPFLPKPPAQ